MIYVNQIIECGSVYHVIHEKAKSHASCFVFRVAAGCGGSLRFREGECGANGSGKRNRENLRGNAEREIAAFTAEKALSYKPIKESDIIKTVVNKNIW
jgi:hypothetical protein